MQLRVKKITLFSILALSLGLVVNRPALAQDPDTQSAKIYQVPANFVPQQATGTDTQQTVNPTPPVNQPHTSIGNAPFTRMTPKQKLAWGAHKAFLSPATYIFPVISSIHQVRNDDEPNKDSGDLVADGLTRYAINMGTTWSRNLLSYGVYPVIYKQDPRYYPARKKGFIYRTFYAASRVVITYGDNGELQPNYSNLSGIITASTLANIYERGTVDNDRRGVRPTFTRFGGIIGAEVLRNIIFREFGPDIKKLIFRK